MSQDTFTVGYELSESRWMKLSTKGYSTYTPQEIVDGLKSGQFTKKLLRHGVWVVCEGETVVANVCSDHQVFHGPACHFTLEEDE